MMKQYLLPLAGCLALSTASSSAALLLTFTEESGDVVLRVSGSVDVSNASFFQDSVTTIQPSVVHGGSGSGVFLRDSPVGVTEEWLIGVDLLHVDLLSARFDASSVSGSGTFEVFGVSFIAYGNTDLGVLDDNVFNASITTSNKVLTFAGESFATMGLDQHTVNTTHDLWGAHAGATDSEKVHFRVETTAVPEPSSTALLGFGSLGLLLRRRR